MSKIRISLGYSLNLGNYESARYDFSVEDEKKPGETTDQAFDRIYDYVEGKLKGKLTEDRKNIAKSQNSHRQTTAPGSD